MTTKQETLDTETVKDRVFKAEHMGGNFFLAKRDEMIPLPRMTSSSDDTAVEPYLEIATKIDSTINNFYQLTLEENTYFISKDLGLSRTEGHVPVRYHNAIDLRVARDHDFRDEIWRQSQASPRMGSIQYNNDGSVKVYIQEDLADIVETLFGTDDSLFVPDSNAFAILIDNTIEAIDDLFIQQGFEPTQKRRTSLISLIFGMTEYLLQNKEIQKLLGTTLETHKINNPNLIQAAARGIDVSMMKLFYTNGTYPENFEDMVDLTAIPFEMLYGIWHGKAQG